MSESEPTFDAHACENGHLTYPGHERCPDCGAPQEETVDLSGETAEVVTWTTSTATPPGVRQPNHLAIVEFDVEGQAVRALGQLTTGEVEIGDEVRPVYASRLRNPDAGIRHPDSQEWDGFRFEPVE
ncbi:Zn-ribbon domain-containing OB-fold protein [Halospeciosus flavus]|uniref:Zn-ribbon domain-containing OB-fold protein n=1 Tax=Halospeciosus flavus TaxID=3032283 RepID=A0ABD5Z2N5_9EURY|nr:OB-fold domain-containing protein [Halospeciosus flavus]